MDAGLEGDSPGPGSISIGILLGEFTADNGIEGIQTNTLEVDLGFTGELSISHANDLTDSVSAGLSVIFSAVDANLNELGSFAGIASLSNPGMFGSTFLPIGFID